MKNPLDVLKKYWGYDSFRSQQKEIIEYVINGNDTVALLSTGAGKSICYQVPAMCFEGKTIVISPLIALMTDQVANLKKRGINALSIHAGMSYRQVDICIDNFVLGPAKILYLSPERANTDIFLERFKAANISLIAIDESHCISQWGYDFRPSYFELNQLRELKPKVPIIAVTATATDKVLEDIVDKLTLHQPKVFKSSFLRDNLRLNVIRNENKEEELFSMLGKLSGKSGIIYQRSRRSVKELSDRLNTMGYNTAYYHGGLRMDRRAKIQQDWLDNEINIIVCTNAFGMGVDKPDVRFVIHFDLPPSIEEYYQEVGRAGRDGNTAIATMIVNHNDVLVLDKKIATEYPDLKYIYKIYSLLCSYLNITFGHGEGEVHDFNINLFSNKIEERISNVFAALKVIEKEGWISMSQAIHSPSQVKFISSKHTISHSKRSEELKGSILDALLRRYEGLFIDFGTIDEDYIAQKLGVKVEDVMHQLQVMHNECIISYRPTTDLPRITFLLDRPAKNSFRISEKSYHQRKFSAIARKKSVIDFVFSEKCRFKTILRYFNEEIDKCGQCDICRGAHETQYTQKDLDSFITYLNKKNRINMRDFLLQSAFTMRGKIKGIITFLESEGVISIDSNEMITLKK